MHNERKKFGSQLAIKKCRDLHRYVQKGLWTSKRRCCNASPSDGVELLKPEPRRMPSKGNARFQQLPNLEASSKTPEGAVYFLGKLLALDA
jgi:hypothetical protein